MLPLQGWYWVTVSNSNGCTDTDSVYVDSQTSSRTPITALGEVRIYPNPVQNTLFVDLDLTINHGLMLELYSISGSLIYRDDIKRAGITEAQIDMQNMTPGTYFLKVATDDKLHNFMVIVE